MKQSDFFNQEYVKIDEESIADWKIVDYKLVLGKKILTVGSGSASDLWFLADRNKIYALDLAREAINIARLHGIHASIYDAQNKLPYEDNTFDIVVLKDILEHLVEPEKLLSEGKRLLKNDGYMVISIPNNFSLWFRIRMLFGKNLIWKALGGFDHTKYFEEWNYMHLRFFTWVGFQKFLEVHGLKIIKTFWDFDTLAHYNDPEMYLEIMQQRVKEGNLIAKRFMFYYRFFKIFSLLFPKKLRSKVVSLNPGLLCSGFYVHVKKA